MLDFGIHDHNTVPIVNKSCAGTKSIKQHIRTSGTMKFASMVLILATAFLIDLRMQNGFREEDYRSKAQVIGKTAVQIKEKGRITSGSHNSIQLLNELERNS